jgi:hypothetical protein
MHPYSIDTSERKYSILIFAIIGIALSWGFHKIISYYKIELPWWAESPSVLFFFGLIFMIFDKWAWKIFTNIRFIKTPNLNGEWIGHLKTSFDEHSSKKEAKLTIFQTWTKIKIILITDESSSQSDTASILTETPEGKYLNYQYTNKPKPEAVSTMSIHLGTGQLFYNKKENTLVGEYYSGRDRQNYGILHFKKIQGYKNLLN